MLNDIIISDKDAGALLSRYHFGIDQLTEDVVKRLGSIQYDPLNVVGRNADLVFQSRSTAYRLSDWQKLAYKDRLLFDGWDKQASLVQMADWPVRRIYHKWHADRWQKHVLDEHPSETREVLKELKTRGPLTSSEFHFQITKPQWKNSWYGPRLTKNILRGLWHTGVVQTYDRKNGHHVYDLSENIIPQNIYKSAAVSDEASVKWLILQRHKAVGILRPTASSEVWSMDISPKERKEVIAKLVGSGELLKVYVDGELFHAPKSFFESDKSSNSQMRFIAPLDQIMWDRKAVKLVYGFDYRWEVYTPVNKRRWGYYVLPVLYKDKFIARFDSRLVGKTWELYRWIWEDGVDVDIEILEAMQAAVKRFIKYLQAEEVKLPKSGMDQKTRKVFKTIL